MSQTSAVRGGLYKVSEWIMRFSLVNLQWVVFNLPVAFLLLSLLNSGSKSDLYVLLPLLAIMIPPVFFPATTAMVAKAREWVRENHDQRPERTYWSYYKENYKKSIAGGAFFTVLWAVLVADIYYFSTMNIWMTNVFLVLGILLFVVTMNYFSVIVHFDMKLGQAIKQAFLVTLVSPLLFVTVALTSGIILYISLYIFPLIIPIFSGTILTFLTFSAYYRHYLKRAGDEGTGYSSQS
ncbi:YesL family protein [Halobacillus salinus]|uniref:YesL family protein n=1 Tax=Halobacillus salinus TaxID=192814 RepID=UPI0009A69C9D|nr:DUF624 domain-containing protein [Halobacillus salinus]